MKIKMPERKSDRIALILFIVSLICAIVTFVIVRAVFEETINAYCSQMRKPTEQCLERLKDK